MLSQFFFLSTILSFLTFIIYPVTVRYSTEEQALLDKIQRESLASKKNYQDFNLREEKITHLGLSPNKEKILFYKKIRIKNKILQELLLFDTKDNILDRYILENIKNYREKKKALVAENTIMLHSFAPSPVSGNVVSLAQGLITVLIDYNQEKQKVTFYLGEKREKFILGSRQFKNLITPPLQVKEVYSFANDTIVIFIINYLSLQDNLFYLYQQEIIPFVLNEKSLNKATKVTSKNNFALNKNVLSTLFLQENYFDFQDRKISQINYFFTGEQKEELFSFNPIYIFFR